MTKLQKAARNASGYNPEKTSTSWKPYYDMFIRGARWLARQQARRKKKKVPR